MNSVNTRTISPRIPLIVAVSTEGEVYFSLTQVNTDDEVKRLFLTELAAVLDLERPSWRKDTVVLMDNAGYNKTEEIMTQIQRLKMPVIFSALLLRCCPRRAVLRLLQARPSDAGGGSSR